MEDTVENDTAKGSTKGATSSKESERKKRALIAIGKAKGFLTHEEVNEHMPEDVTSPERMDDWLSAFADEGIEIVDAPAKVKVVDADADEADEADEADADLAAKGEAKEEEDTDSNAPTSDPVRTYLRKMGTISLLTREGEVQIAKRIEDGDRRVLQVV